MVFRVGLQLVGLREGARLLSGRVELGLGRKGVVLLGGGGGGGGGGAHSNLRFINIFINDERKSMELPQTGD